MARSISRRTASPNRRRRRLRSMAASRSSASPSSRSRSASRVTRKAQFDSTSMPGKSSPRRAAMICSRGTKRSPSGRGTKRGSRGGTLTRAKRRSPDRGLRTSTARLSDRLEMWGKGWPGSTASGVSTGKMRWSNSSPRYVAVVVVDVVPPAHVDPGLGQRRHHPVGEDRRLLVDQVDHRHPDGPQLLRRRRARRATRLRARAACCSLRIATRTWKNSSRLLAKMARNLARSSTGVSGSSARASTRWLNSSQLSSRLR